MLTGLAVHVVVSYFGLNVASTTTTATPTTPTIIASSTTTPTATATSTTGVAKVRERDLYPPINSKIDADIK